MQPIKVKFRTNLDLDNESWPEYVICLPQVGHIVKSNVIHKNGFRLELEVTGITWVEKTIDGIKAAFPEIELHMTSWQRELMPIKNEEGNIAKGSITAFYQWYAPKVGRSVGSFI